MNYYGLTEEEFQNFVNAELIEDGKNRKMPKRAKRRIEKAKHRNNKYDRIEGRRYA